MITYHENRIEAPAIIIPYSFRAVAETVGSGVTPAATPLSRISQPLLRVEKVESWMPTFGAGRGRLDFNWGFVPDALWRVRTSVNKNGIVQGAEIAENANNFLNLREGDVLADLGCGPGVIARYLAPKVGETGWVYALDASPGMLENTERSLAGIRHTTIHGDIHTVDKLIKEKVDAVVLSGNIHLLSNPEKALKAIRQILKPMGKLVIICHAYFHGGDNTSNYFSRLIDQLMETRTDLFAQGLRLPMLSPRELTRIKVTLVKCGFGIQQSESDIWSPDSDNVFGNPPQITIKKRFEALGLNLSEAEAEKRAQLVVNEVSAGRQSQIYLLCTKVDPALRFAIPTNGKTKY